MKRKTILMYFVCLLVLSVPSDAHREVWLIRSFYEVTPGRPMQPLEIRSRTYDVLTDHWHPGDTYRVCAPEKEGYVFLSAISDKLSGTFGEGDLYLNLYYTRKKFR